MSKRVFEFPHNFKQEGIEDSPPSHILTLGCQLAVPSRLSIEKWGAVLDGVQAGNEIAPHAEVRSSVGAAEAEFIKSFEMERERADYS